MWGADQGFDPFFGFTIQGPNNQVLGGPAHWELLQRGRALDNQLYVCTVSPARDESASYHAWGHSTVVSPWGDVVATTSHEPDIVFAELDFEKVEEIRTNIPVSKQKREDLYSLNSKM